MNIESIVKNYQLYLDSDDELEYRMRMATGWSESSFYTLMHSISQILDYAKSTGEYSDLLSNFFREDGELHRIIVGLSNEIRFSKLGTIEDSTTLLQRRLKDLEGLRKVYDQSGLTT